MTVTKSIGSAGGRDYSTLQAWEDARPATLTDAEVGECYNDSEFTAAGAMLTLSGITTSSTNTLTLKCAAGQSFRDNASVQTNALRYNVSNGVGVRTTNSYTATITVSTNNTIIDGLQVKNTNTSGRSIAISGTNDANIWQNCILEHKISSTSIYTIYGSSSKIRNCLLVNHDSGANAFAANLGNGASIYNSTGVRPSNVTASSSAFRFQYGSPNCKNTAGFGFSGFSTGGASPAGSNNASDQTIGFGSSNQASKTYANQFQATDASAGAHDFRLKSGADCIDTGTTDATNGTPDIANTSRPSGSAYDIGCWEFVSAAAFIARQGLNIIQAVNRASTY